MRWWSSDFSFSQFSFVNYWRYSNERTGRAEKDEKLQKKNHNKSETAISQSRWLEKSKPVPNYKQIALNYIKACQ